MLIFVGKSSPDDQKGVEELTYSSRERICGSSSTALCVIAFLDNENKAYIKSKEEVLDKIRKSRTLRVLFPYLFLLFLSR